MYFYGAGNGSARLGLEEGEPRLACPPGQVKVHLSAWPWQKCVPEEEMVDPPSGQFAPPPVEAPGAATPSPVPSAGPGMPPIPIPRQVHSVAPPPAAPAQKTLEPAGRARFLQLDTDTGELRDPATGESRELRHVMVLSEGAGIGIGVGVGIAALAVVLIAVGVIKFK